MQTLPTFRLSNFQPRDCLIRHGLVPGLIATVIFGYCPRRSADAACIASTPKALLEAAAGLWRNAQQTLWKSTAYCLCPDNDRFEPDDHAVACPDGGDRSTCGVRWSGTVRWCGALISDDTGLGFESG